MAGALLLCLHREAGAGIGQLLLDALTTMTDDDIQMRTVQACSGVSHMTHHRLACQRVQHLRQFGTHAGALACGKNDDVGTLCAAHR